MDICEDFGRVMFFSIPRFSTEYFKKRFKTFQRLEGELAKEKLKLKKSKKSRRMPTNADVKEHSMSSIKIE